LVTDRILYIRRRSTPWAASNGIEESVMLVVSPESYGFSPSLEPKGSQVLRLNNNNSGFIALLIVLIGREYREGKLNQEPMWE